MANEERIAAIKALLSQYVAERVKAMADGATLRAVDVESDWEEFVQKWFEDYKGEDKVPHYIIKELIKHLETITKPYNVPYVQEITVDSWAGEEPELTLYVPADVHNLLGSIEVNVYAKRGETCEIVQCGVTIDDDKNISIRTATKFSGRVEIFSSVGETPELQHRQPVYTINGLFPDEAGNVSFEDLSDLLIQAHNNNPEAHGALFEKIMLLVEAMMSWEDGG